MSLLKEAIAEFDTSDTVDVKGPMLDGIISWDGDGELPIYKDAASILERYYFDENADNGVETLDEAEYENDKGSAAGPAMKSSHGTGTDQAGTSDADSIDGAKKEKEKDIAKEQEEVGDKDEDEKEEVEEMEVNDKDVPKGKEYTDESADLEMENAIIEKLIAEMEDESDDEDEDEGDEEEVEEAEVMGYTGSGPKDEAPDEKKASGPEEDAQGAGTQQAGTGDAEGQVPPRKDLHDKFVKPKEYTDESKSIDEALAQLERELLEQDDDEGGDEEEKELDVDKEMSEQAPPAPSAVPGGPSPKSKGEDEEDDEGAYSEAFKLFKEQIEEEIEDIDSDDIRV